MQVRAPRCSASHECRALSFECGMHSSAHDTVDLEIMWRPSELVRGKFAENLQLETSIHIASMADFSARARQAWEDQVGAAGGERHLRAAERNSW